ncbi:MAG TPA: 50S ribosomal protein L11 methyltransferase [Stellaceae bacterium]|nr:50S ribosomal protein L11 methyltransferase [Stellaceae bacterium]
MIALWRVYCTVADAASAERAARAFDDAVASVSAFEAEPEGTWLVEGMSLDEPDAKAVELCLALAWIGSGASAPSFAVERVAPRDWLAENQRGFPPIVVGRYVVHGAHWREALPAGKVALVIDAATAFGTGEHGSTRGCLVAIDALSRRRRFRRVLDMGTGTGILAIAAAKTWRSRVGAFDNDPEAVRVARRNVAANGVAHVVAPARAGSHGERALVRRAPFDLVLANILARPLVAMARGLARNLAPEGVAVLSGLLPWQESAVLAAHRRVRLTLAARVSVDGWSTLVLSRRGAARGQRIAHRPGSSPP